ncbi:hypothetical protein PC116_g18527 [Phytophthora cactorum]|uniref:Uncharacterized protein n=1 Tax=Phytophthora cactorum TaxID=29920 RepID=A0A8T1K8P2_9STRA|nr:hypothetical protein Pcac1_g1175 [Phytophthora cactorum]KAG2892892.1 hypothetical protein PC114_g16455 [Phytophthora cactorum]KAG2925774.1 hypothetical protein PC117_g15084 [Phytophthora cactorum]KAG3003571.1 hypothetical protein PC119_g15925 [Phytophthora cactorum]KAG3029795.1 hypothetical protein PC120_g4093 [Phytophthora cactorum]
MVNMPPVDVDDRPLPRWKCVCCEHLLARDPYCYRLERLDRGEVRRCLECREGPERQRHWHKVDLPPRWEPDLNRQGARKKFIRRRTQPPKLPHLPRNLSRSPRRASAVFAGGAAAALASSSGSSKRILNQKYSASIG